ncbi:hypothetical protein GGR52DRAFT_133877 [Hypoxylon sp. FL1284]|nr:hypothetical protein GGR52DRAFT_133877 [Hypoxylon sp. FL1284]
MLYRASVSRRLLILFLLSYSEGIGNRKSVLYVGRTSLFRMGLLALLCNPSHRTFGSHTFVVCIVLDARPPGFMKRPLKPPIFSAHLQGIRSSASSCRTQTCCRVGR